MESGAISDIDWLKNVACQCQQVEKCSLLMSEYEKVQTVDINNRKSAAS